MNTETMTNAELDKFKRTIKGAYFMLQRQRSLYDSHLDMMERAKPHASFTRGGEFDRMASTHANYCEWIVTAEARLTELRADLKDANERFISLLNS